MYHIITKKFRLDKLFYRFILKYFKLDLITYLIINLHLNTLVLKTIKYGVNMKINILFGGVYSQLIKSSRATIEIDSDYIDLEKIIDIIKENFKIDIKNDVEQGNILLLINGRNIKYLNKVKINDGDFISLLPPVKGG